jgi:hypothetical protein
MRRFFLAQRVGVEVVARPLPHEVQPAQRPPQGVVGDPLPGGDLQRLQEQRHGPVHVRVAKFLRRGGQEGLQEVFGVLVQQRQVPVAPAIPQGGGVAGAGVRLDPVVDRLPGNAEHAGDVGGRAAVVELQDGQGSAEEANVLGGRELPPEAAPLPRSQV